jgi:hypothetical protein
VSIFKRENKQTNELIVDQENLICASGGERVQEKKLNTQAQSTGRRREEFGLSICGRSSIVASVQCRLFCLFCFFLCVRVS